MKSIALFFSFVTMMNCFAGDIQKLSDDELYELATKKGVGSCYILNNEGSLGVINSGEQISETTEDIKEVTRSLRDAVRKGKCQGTWSLEVEEKKLLKMGNHDLLNEGLFGFGQCSVEEKDGHFATYFEGMKVTSSTTMEDRAASDFRRIVSKGICLIQHRDLGEKGEKWEGETPSQRLYRLDYESKKRRAEIGTR